MCLQLLLTFDLIDARCADIARCFS